MTRCEIPQPSPTFTKRLCLTISTGASSKPCFPERFRWTRLTDRSLRTYRHRHNWTLFSNPSLRSGRRPGPGSECQDQTASRSVADARRTGAGTRRSMEQEPGMREKVIESFVRRRPIHQKPVVISGFCVLRDCFPSFDPGVVQHVTLYCSITCGECRNNLQRVARNLSLDNVPCGYKLRPISLF